MADAGRAEKPMNENRRHWQKILWREWRHCEDQGYARALFALISPEPIAWWAPVLAYMLVGALYGSLGGVGGALRMWMY